jgi:hypothetical protein
MAPAWITNQRPSGPGFVCAAGCDVLETMWKWNGEVSPLACPSKSLLRDGHRRISRLFISQTRRETNWIARRGGERFVGLDCKIRLVSRRSVKGIRLVNPVSWARGDETDV